MLMVFHPIDALMDKPDTQLSECCRVVSAGIRSLIIHTGGNLFYQTFGEQILMTCFVSSQVKSQLETP